MTVSRQIQSLSEELEGVRTERKAEAQSRSEETEELQNRVASVSHERDLLQGVLEGLKEEKEQLRAELGDRMEKLQTQVSRGFCGSKQPNSTGFRNTKYYTCFVFLLAHRAPAPTGGAAERFSAG